ncbi:MAG: M15 family metallopeptidase [Thermodesulfobacteriota bacterium]
MHCQQPRIRLLLFSILLISPVLSAANEDKMDESVQETVVINKVAYPVPPPWQGRELDAKEPLTAPPLVRIPTHLSAEQAKLYLLPDACTALIEMGDAAALDGIELKVDSSYRSGRYQKIIFTRLMAEGRTFDDIIRYVAPPGYSEHMLGTVVDFAPGNWRFAETPAYQWLRTNANHFGFHETLPESSPDGIPWESWHWQYKK